MTSATCRIGGFAKHFTYKACRTHHSSYHSRPFISRLLGDMSANPLREHFQDVKGEEQTGRWDAMWQQNITPWDRAGPNPALMDVLDERNETLLGSALDKSATGERRKALVPGCGRGYDVLLLASHGFDAYGLDAAQTAIEHAKEVARQQGADESKYPVKDTSTGRGEARFLLADFFKDDYLTSTRGADFDIIYDYTFLCALPPDLRPKWAKRMSDLLAPGGRLICLEFPLAKPPHTGGPPHGLSSELYVELFKQPGGAIDYDEDGRAVSKSDRNEREGALKRISHWKPIRTHPVGAESDMVSVWKHVSH